MTTPDPRDRALDGLLRQELSRAAEASDVCLDAETLAAWMDGGLDADAQARIEAHAAGCARCQALMAAIVTSEPAPATAAAEPWWNRWSLRWLVPLTAAAAATLVWMIVPGGEPSRVPVEQARTQARAEAAAPPATVEAPAAEPPASELQKALPGPARKDERDAASSRPSGDAARYSARETAPPVPPPARAEAEPKAVQPAPSDTLAPLTEAVRVERERRSAEASTGRQAAAAPAQAPAAQAQAAPAAGAAAGAREGFADANALSLGIVSRDPVVRWRLAGPGAVERSTDAGVSWTRLATGVEAIFTAGSAPSASVCWLVGRGGLVLLTTDARTWRRVATPTTDDLVAIDATDAATATVRTAGGRAFRTTDGGVTWRRMP